VTDLDRLISTISQGHGAAVAVGVAFLLGLRHASDPDHLVAVSTLVAGRSDRAGRAAGRLGAAWGLGHATTMLVFGVPILLLQFALPRPLESSAELLIGAIIVLLAARLLVQWRRGVYHVHAHTHDDAVHLHFHSHDAHAHHGHAHVARSPLQAFGIGLVHGMAGSAGITVLLVAAVPSRPVAAASLCVLAIGTAMSMTVLSALVGRVLAAAEPRRHLARAVPALGFAATLFGVWYAAGALAGI
jgi:ABC-type nickel/cobalt efflux system permease component RcnA